MQRKAALWILGVFWTSPFLGIEAITGLIPINLHFQKLSGRLQLHTQLLLPNYLIKLLLESRYSSYHNKHYLLMENLTSKQRLKVKSFIINANNRLNGIFYSFNPFNNKFSPEDRLIDMFSSHFSFYISDRKSAKSRKTHLYKLDKIVFNTLINPKTVIIILSTSIKNQVTTSIAYVHVHNSPIIKTIYHTVNVTFTKAELFAIRCGLNQNIQLSNIECIVVITDSIYVAKKIFDSSIHSYQVQTSVISKKIREFFKRSHHNSIDFWDCSSQHRWLLYNIIDKETKRFNLSPLFPCKSL